MAQPDAISVKIPEADLKEIKAAMKAKAPNAAAVYNDLAARFPTPTARKRV